MIFSVTCLFTGFICIHLREWDIYRF